jgi:hypothetical protein
VIDLSAIYLHQAVLDPSLAISGSVFDNAGNDFFLACIISMDGNLIKSVQSDARVFMVDTLLRDTHRALHTALVACPQVQANTQSTFLF